MSLVRRAVGALGRRGATRAGDLAPGPTAAVLHRALHASITGVGPLTGAREYAEEARAGRDDLEQALDSVVSAHVRLSGLQGFATNLGGLVTAAASVPANVSGQALLHCRMVAAIAALGGHDLDDDGVRNAVLVCLLGRDDVASLVADGRLPGTPAELARGAVAVAPDQRDLEVGSGSTDLDRLVSARVAAALVGDALGSGLATTIGKRIPVIGGVVGAGTDAWATKVVGGYAREELGPAPA